MFCCMFNTGDGPVLSRDASDPYSLTLSCSIDYAGSNVQPNIPVFTWKNGTSLIKQEIPVALQVDSYSLRSVSQLSIDRSDVTIYECLVTFKSTTDSPYNCVTSTAPIFIASYFSSSKF